MADLIEAERDQLKLDLAAAEKRLEAVWEVFHLLDGFIGSMPSARRDLLGEEGWKKYKQLMGHDEDHEEDDEWEDCQETSDGDDDAQSKEERAKT